MTNEELVVQNLTLLEAIEESKRCLHCKKPLCKQGCPIENDIPEFIAELAKGNLGEAYQLIANKSNLPAVCGRVCPHELQCEGHCILNKKGQGIRVGEIERVIADFNYDMHLEYENIAPKTRGKIAVIGSGPAGLTVAGDLAKIGFHVSVFESEPEPGGVLLYGIPEFRLPKVVVRREIDHISAQGVTFTTNTVAGVDFTIDDLFDQQYDAIFIGTGTAVDKNIDLPNGDLTGIIQANYLLRTISLYNSKQINRDEVSVSQEDHVIVIGGGNVAMDAARSAKRFDAASVTVVYHRKQEDMSALKAEVDDAIEDGVKFAYESKPAQFVGSNGVVEGLEVETPDGLRIIPATKIFLAVGSRPANRIVSTTEGIDVDERGYVISRDKPYGMTTRKGVFAGGDVVHSPATVVLAMKDAKKVAEGIASYVDAVKLLEA